MRITKHHIHYNNDGNLVAEGNGAQAQPASQRKYISVVGWHFAYNLPQVNVHKYYRFVSFRSVPFRSVRLSVSNSNAEQYYA